MKFGQLIEYNMRIIFAEKSYTKYGGETISLLLLYSINWLNLIVWLPLLRKILGNVCIVIVC